MPEKISKVLLMASIAIFSSLVAFNNITDYGSNFQFVRHVLMMDTTFPGNKGMWRAVESPIIHHAAYIVIIAIEVSIAILAWIGATQLWQARNDSVVFNERKTVATYAIALGIFLWFTGFIAGGGEWFLMWQSGQWNGIQAAFRIVTFLVLVLIFLTMKDDD